MSSYTIQTGDFAAHAKSLAANTMDTVTFAATAGSGYKGDQVDVEVFIHTSQQAVYVTVDGSDVTVAGGKSYVILSGGTRKIPVARTGATVVKIISGGTATYSVLGTN